MNEDVASSPTTERVTVGAIAPATPVRHPLERDLALRGLAGRFLEPAENGATAADLLYSAIFDAATVHLSISPSRHVSPSRHSVARDVRCTADFESRPLSYERVMTTAPQPCHPRGWQPHRPRPQPPDSPRPQALVVGYRAALTARAILSNVGARSVREVGTSTTLIPPGSVMASASS